MLLSTMYVLSIIDKVAIKVYHNVALTVMYKT